MIVVEFGGDIFVAPIKYSFPPNQNIGTSMWGEILYPTDVECVERILAVEGDLERKGNHRSMPRLVESFGHHLLVLFIPETNVTLGHFDPNTFHEQYHIFNYHEIRNFCEPLVGNFSRRSNGATGSPILCSGCAARSQPKPLPIHGRRGKRGIGFGRGFDSSTPTREMPRLRYV